MSTTPDAIQVWAAKQQADQDAIAAALNTIGTTIGTIATGVAALQALITTLQNSPGAITPADQATLDSMETAAATLATQANTAAAALAAINTAAPGTVPPPPPGPRHK